MYPGYDIAAADPRATRELRLEIEEFHAAYCWTLDRGALAEWPEYFADDAVYRITARENVDAGLEVGLVYADSKAMIRDRAFALQHTQMYAPRYMQHFVTNVRVLEARGEARAQTVKAQANYLLLQTLVEGPTTIHQAGRYYDTFVRAGAKLLLKERQCVYDTVLIANDLVFPV
jgi:3-phenylpropionate/cinnamic acid dioxygenase small subunit